jgi:two-component sensor histidine kinase
VHRLQGSIAELRAEIAVRRRAERALTETARQSEALFRLADRLNRANTLQEVVEVALDTIENALNCDRAALLLRDTAGVMRYMGWRGLSQQYRAAAEGRSPWPTNEREPQSYRVSDIDTSAVPEDLKTAIKHEGIRALCMFPIAGTGKRIGRFVGYYDRARVFSPNENEIGLAIARQLGISVEKKLAEERETLLRREVQHRTKNLFAVIQAVARRSLSGHPGLESARDAFVGRIMALARADQQLNESESKGARLKELVECELAPFAGRYCAEGADVLLNAKTVQNFSLALHELATNAAKYGAFSTPGGAVHIGWTANGLGDNLKLTWKEAGGPPVSPPARSGFGTALLSATLGSARIDYAPDGLVYEAEIPVTSE